MSELAAAAPAPSVVATTARTAPLKTSKVQVPGAGSSALISVVTVVGLLVLWFVVTNVGWIKPLFLPSPQAVFRQFLEYVNGTSNDRPLWQHAAASLLRVFSAFALACVTAIPV